MIKNIEDETLQNIQNHIEEQDLLIAKLLEACIWALTHIKCVDLSDNKAFKNVTESLQQAINKAERK